MLTPEPKLHQTTAALRLSILTATGLAILKLATGWLTNSMAVIASSLDSLMDIATSVVNLIAAREAAKPPDEDHAYGHGKIESLAALFQSVLIGVSGFFIAYESVKRLIYGSHVKEIPVGIGVMLISFVASTLLARRLKVVAEHTHSVILATERLHYTSDILFNGGVIAALLLVRLTQFVFWDLIFSLLVSAAIFKASYGILSRAIDELLDKSLPPVSKEEIENLIRNYHPTIVGLHEFRSRRVGPKIFLDFHIEIRGEDDFRRAHEITEALINQIKEKYPGADTTVHYDPEGAM